MSNAVEITARPDSTGLVIDAPGAEVDYQGHGITMLVLDPTRRVILGPVTPDPERQGRFTMPFSSDTGLSFALTSVDEMDWDENGPHFSMPEADECPDPERVASDLLAAIARGRSYVAAPVSA